MENKERKTPQNEQENQQLSYEEFFKMPWDDQQYVDGIKTLKMQSKENNTPKKATSAARKETKSEPVPLSEPIGKRTVLKPIQLNIKNSKLEALIRSGDYDAICAFAEELDQWAELLRMFSKETHPDLTALNPPSGTDAFYDLLRCLEIDRIDYIDYMQDLLSILRVRSNEENIKQSLSNQIKGMLQYTTKLDEEKRSSILQKMYNCYPYLTLNEIDYFLDHVRTIDSFDLDIWMSYRSNLINEMQYQRMKKISAITISKKEILEIVTPRTEKMSESFYESYSDSLWRRITSYLRATFEFSLSDYIEGKEYSVNVFDAINIITYGIMLLDNSYNTFLDKLRKKDFLSITAAEIKQFWKLERTYIEQFLGQYIKEDKKEYGFCRNKKAHCIDCPDEFKCTHKAGIERFIINTELAFNDVAQIRDKVKRECETVLGKAKKFEEKIRKFCDSPRNTDEYSYEDFCFTMCKFLDRVIEEMKKAEENELRICLPTHWNDDDLIEENIPGKFGVEISTTIPLLERAVYENDASKYDLMSKINTCFDSIVFDCYNYILLCPSYAESDTILDETQMISQKSKLLRQAFEDATEFLMDTYI